MEIMTDFGAAPLLVDSITLIDHPMVVNVDTPSREDSTNSDDNDLAADHNPMYSIPIDFISYDSTFDHCARLCTNVTSTDEQRSRFETSSN